LSSLSRDEKNYSDEIKWRPRLAVTHIFGPRRHVNLSKCVILINGIAGHDKHRLEAEFDGIGFRL
jgi:hypothetical protein